MKQLKWFVTAILVFAVSTLSLAELQIYIPFNEGSGDTAKDATGNGHDAVLQGAEWTDGHEGTAVQFGESFVEIPYPDDPDVFNGNFTYTLWINAPLAGNTWQQLVRCYPYDGTGRNSLFVNNAGFVSWRGFSEGGWTAWSTNPENLINANEWTFVAISNDMTNFSIYINGELVQQDSFVESDGGITTINLGYGADEAGAEDYSGIIDEFSLWNEALSADSIANAMSNGVTAVEPIDKLSVRWGNLKLEK